MMNPKICRKLFYFFSLTGLLVFEFQSDLFAQQLVPTAQSTLAAGSVKLPQVDVMSSVFAMIKGLAICIGLLFLVIWLLKKFRAPIVTGQGRKLKIIERLPVTARSSILLVEVNQKQVLIGVGADPVNLISDFVEADSVQILDKRPETDEKS